MRANCCAAALPESIQKLIDSSPAARTAFWGIQMVDLATGKTLYELNPDHYFVPASNAKLFSTALALTRLGADYTFQTRVFAHAPPDDRGRVRGRCGWSAAAIPICPRAPFPIAWVRSPAIRSPPSRTWPTRSSRAGCKRIDGDIIGDDTWYVWQPYAAGWSIDDPQSDDGPPDFRPHAGRQRAHVAPCVPAPAWASRPRFP